MNTDLLTFRGKYNTSIDYKLNDLVINSMHEFWYYKGVGHHWSRLTPSDVADFVLKSLDSRNSPEPESQPEIDLDRRSIKL